MDKRSSKPNLNKPEPFNTPPSRPLTAMPLPRSFLEIDELTLSHLALSLPLEQKPSKASPTDSVPSSPLASIDAQTKLFEHAEKLWQSWKTEPELTSMLLRYVDVCAFEKPIALKDMRWHLRLSNLGLVKYYLCLTYLGGDRAELWDRHCTLTRYRLYAQSLCFSPNYVGCQYSLSGVEAHCLPPRSNVL